MRTYKILCSAFGGLLLVVVTGSLRADDSCRVSGNSYHLQGKDTSNLPYAHRSDSAIVSAAAYYSQLLEDKDTSNFLSLDRAINLTPNSNPNCNLIFGTNFRDLQTGDRARGGWPDNRLVHNYIFGDNNSVGDVPLRDENANNNFVVGSSNFVGDGNNYVFGVGNFLGNNFIAAFDCVNCSLGISHFSSAFSCYNTKIGSHTGNWTAAATAISDNSSTIDTAPGAFLLATNEDTVAGHGSPAVIMLGTQHSHYSASGDSNMAYMGPGINNAIFAHPGQGPFACADGAQIHGGWNDTILLCRNFAPGVVFNTILNGSNNREKGNHGLIAQGDHDFIDSTADYATILNGTGNSVEGDCGLAIGKGAHAGKDTALFHDSTGMFVVKADGFSGHLYGVAETANYALSSGATKSESFTPSGVSDTLGRTGDIRWDASYIYVKTESGWKRAALRAW